PGPDLGAYVPPRGTGSPVHLGTLSPAERVRHPDTPGNRRDALRALAAGRAAVWRGDDHARWLLAARRAARAGGRGLAVPRRETADGAGDAGDLRDLRAAGGRLRAELQLRSGTRRGARHPRELPRATPCAARRVVVDDRARQARSDLRRQPAGAPASRELPQLGS